MNTKNQLKALDLKLTDISRDTLQILSLPSTFKELQAFIQEWTNVPWHTSQDLGETKFNEDSRSLEGKEVTLLLIKHLKGALPFIFQNFCIFWSHSLKKGVKQFDLQLTQKKPLLNAFLYCVSSTQKCDLLT